MIIKLQRNNSDYNVLDKNISDIIQVEGTLKESTSIYEPVITLELPISNLSRCNYVTIDDFNRKYYIKDIVSVTNQLTQISCHVDVLTTYKEEIRNCYGIVKKQQEKFNLYLDDGTFKSYQNPIINTVTFPTGFDNPSLILLVSGG